jgi:hypothetical protein
MLKIMEHLCSKKKKIMEHKDFSAKCYIRCKLIFNSGSSVVLLNGVPRKTFHCKRGVRQGDPLSSLLFILAVDFLQTLECSKR